MLPELTMLGEHDSLVLLLLRFAATVFERGCLFMVGEADFVGLGGFSADFDSNIFARRIRGLRFPHFLESILNEVVERKAILRAPLAQTSGNQIIAAAMGLEWPRSAMTAFPMLVNGKVAAVLLCDNPSGAPGEETDGLEIFVHQAGLMVPPARIRREFASLSA
jgi:hypothetical protein